MSAPPPLRKLWKLDLCQCTKIEHAVRLVRPVERLAIPLPSTDMATQEIHVDFNHPQQANIHNIILIGCIHYNRTCTNITKIHRRTRLLTHKLPCIVCVWVTTKESIVTSFHLVMSSNAKFLAEVLYLVLPLLFFW